MDTIVAITGLRIVVGTTRYVVQSAGIRNDQPYATVDPPNDTVVAAIATAIQKAMPFPPSTDEIEAELGRQA